MTTKPRLRIREAPVFSRAIQTRLPFRFGKATMTHMPILHFRLKVETEAGKLITGVSGTGIPPLWFDKRNGKTHEDNIHDLSYSLKLALDKYMAQAAAPVWELHTACESTVRKLALAKDLNDLTAGYGIALVDAALIDAACRFTGATFHAALREDLFGFGADMKSILPEKALDKIAIRHTVGLVDPLTAADVTSSVADGLPETLEEVARQYKVKYYKIKISGDVAGSRERLRGIAKVLDKEAGDYQATLDGNEQFKTMDDFADFMEQAKDDPALKDFWRRTLWIEQPVSRDHSLEASVAAPLKRVDAFKPVIIDESDGTDEAVDQALELGYKGISAKNCKGVFRTLHSYRRVKELEKKGVNTVLSSEDLTNAPILPLHQDIAVAAALGITHSERNGHHYIVGFKFLSEKEKADALREFPSLYRTREAQPPVLRIDGGHIDLREVNRTGFGTASEPDWDSLQQHTLPEN